LAAAFSKLEGYAGRLALVLSLTRWAENPGSQGIGPAAIDGESIRAGIAIVKWAKQETRRIYATLQESDEDQEAREVAELVERRGGSLTVRDVQRSLRLKTAEETEEILVQMVKDGWGCWVDRPMGPRGGRPVRCFQLARHDSVKESHPRDTTPEFPQDSEVLSCVTQDKQAGWCEAEGEISGSP
jgi:hypothetical protein